MKEMINLVPETAKEDLFETRPDGLADGKLKEKKNAKKLIKLIYMPLLIW